MGTGFRAVARMLRISPNTEREYRKALAAAGMLEGDPNDLPELATLQAVLEKHRPARLAPQQESSVERWTAEVKAILAPHQGRGDPRRVRQIKTLKYQGGGSSRANQALLPAILRASLPASLRATLPLGVHRGSRAQCRTHVSAHSEVAARTGEAFVLLSPA